MSIDTAIHGSQSHQNVCSENIKLSWKLFFLFTYLHIICSRLEMSDELIQICRNIEGRFATPEQSQLTFKVSIVNIVIEVITSWRYYNAQTSLMTPQRHHFPSLFLSYQLQNNTKNGAAVMSLRAFVRSSVFSEWWIDNVCLINM